jgi:hypothetical protein
VDLSGVDVEPCSAAGIGIHRQVKSVVGVRLGVGIGGRLTGEFVPAE